MRAVAMLFCMLCLAGQTWASPLTFRMGSLKGKVIFEAGFIEQVDCPVYGKYDCLSWPDNLYKVGSFCFLSDDAICYSSGCDGFIVGDSVNDLIAVVPGRMGVVDSSSIKPMKCPSRF